MDGEDIHATHFLIGIYIRNTPDLFTRIFESGGDLAVHTYNHPYMTGLSNEAVVAQVNDSISALPLVLSTSLACVDHGDHSQLYWRSCTQVLEAALW